MDERFRQQLARELPQWQERGWLNPEQVETLRDHYRLDNLTPSNRFATILAIIGSVLVGLGLISLVAANWAYISPGFRAIATLLLMAGCTGGGFVGLRQGQRWGTILLLIGQFAVGGSIGLMAQWFQISGDPAGLFLAWGLSVLAMAVCLRHSLLATLAIFLLFL
ncbi:MAG: DUF2157 domain-containing protein [Synechococcaceae cyanobacterium SM2_3_60]|nr:DUF2157 domain-containing protein [Synechococcaceae cyanobacterium SM2_3_60]